jgi:2,3-bisphosphoglycerate-dependent phosphoglycerate mutase
MELLLIRHARPRRVENADGPADPELDDVGRSQAAALADWLADDPIDAVVASPLRRAIETAGPLAEALRLELTHEEGVVEWDRDHDSYIPIEELKANDDPAWVAMREGRWDLLGLDPQAFRARVVEAIDTVAAAHPGGRVAVVCHGGVINAYTSTVLGLDRLLWFEPDYTSVSRILVSRKGTRSLRSLNETGHLMGRRAPSRSYGGAASPGGPERIG